MNRRTKVVNGNNVRTIDNNVERKKELISFQKLIQIKQFPIIMNHNRIEPLNDTC